MAAHKFTARRQGAAVSTFIVLITLAGCSARPECQHDPAFYLRGTAFDCQTFEVADASKGVRP